MDLALYVNDEVSREHLVLRRDAATGQFSIVDKSTNGTWLFSRIRRTSSSTPASVAPAFSARSDAR